MQAGRNEITGMAQTEEKLKFSFFLLIKRRQPKGNYPFPALPADLLQQKKGHKDGHHTATINEESMGKVCNRDVNL